MKHKRQTQSKTDDEDNKDSLKGDDDSQPCSKFSILLFYMLNFIWTCRQKSVLLKYIH